MMKIKRIIKLFTSVIIITTLVMQMCFMVYATSIQLNSKISAAFRHSMLIDGDGTLWGIGDNLWGQMGNDTGIDAYRPKKIMDNVHSVSSIFYHVGAIIYDNSLWAWGLNSSGQLGNGTSNNSNEPEKIMDKVVAVTTGSYHTMVIKDDASLWAFGDNEYGQLGTGNNNSSYEPVKILEDVSSASAGSVHTMIIKGDGSLWGFGSNEYGQLGIGEEGGYFNEPIEIMKDVLAVSAGSKHTLVIKNDNSLWAFGNNEYGQLGTGDNDNKYIPTKIMDSVVYVSAAVNHPDISDLDVSHSLVVKDDGSLWAFGNNEYGQLGIGNNISSSVPIKVNTMDNVYSVSAGTNHSLAIKQDGTFWSWGNNDYGQLGTGDNIGSVIPIQIMFDYIDSDINIFLYENNIDKNDDIISGDLSIVLENNLSEIKDAVVSLAVYSMENKLIDAFTKGVSIETGDNFINLDLNVDNANASAYIIKVFVWDNFLDMQPITKSAWLLVN